MSTVAVVDIGSNSVRLLIARRTPDGGIEELVRDTNVTRLGQGVDAAGRLADDAIGRTQAVLADYARQIDEYDAERRIARRGQCCRPS